MAILDAGPFQTWIAAFDKHEQALKRYNAAGSLRNKELSDYLLGNLNLAANELNEAIKQLNA